MNRFFKYGILAIAMGFGLATIVSVSGCIRLLQQPPLPRTEYSFSFHPPHKAPSNIAPILAVRLFDAAPMFENQEFVYRLSPMSWETDFYNIFSEPPSVLLTFQTRRWMQYSGLFRSVAIPGLAPAESWQLQGFLSELYGDFQDTSKPAAVISMRFTFLPPGSQASTQPLFNNSYEHREFLTELSPKGLIDAWNRGAEAILTKLSADIRYAKQSYGSHPHPPPPPTSKPQASTPSTKFPDVIAKSPKHEE